jgi:hypothetical protein
MVQQARMQHDSTARPSAITGNYWLECKPLIEHTPTPRAGEWVIETDLTQVDALWTQIRTATIAGHLGYKSKVATASRSIEHPQQRVIVVRTVDADQTDDVTRVGEQLRAMGITPNRYERING